MEGLQQTVFQNFNSETPYNFCSKKLTNKHALFPKYRYQQLENQFQLVDLHDKGYLSEQQIINYLSDKYQWVNTQILRNLFTTMQWKSKNRQYEPVGDQINDKKSKKQLVTKQQFCQKYLERQKKLYHEINGLKYYASWVKSLEQIYIEELRAGTPRSYFYFQIKKIELYHEGKPVQWMDLIFKYENHDKKVQYQIEQASHQAMHPSLQVWLPSQKDHFFLKFQFMDMQDHDFIYGQSYINIKLEHKMPKKTSDELPIMKAGKKVGICTVMYRLQPNMDIVRDQLQILKKKQPSYNQIIDEKNKQYEYLQFLWGVRHISPHKISKMDVQWVIILRIVLLIFLGILGIICNVLGRCQPISMVLAFILLKNYNLVIYREQKFYISWLIIAGILLDLVWLSIASSTKSQINFIELDNAKIVTYPLIVTKFIYFVYMLLYQKSFTSRETDNR